MKPLFLFSFLIFLTLTGTTCKESNPVDHNCTDCPTEPDTTSHNFIWSLDTLGAEGSVVNDVAVISENDIWVVGKFYRVPYGGDDTVAYNAMHWDGSKWELKSIPIKNFSGTISATQLTAVWGKATNEVWVISIGGSYGKYNGTSWQSEWISEAQGGITRIWGESSNKLYFGGTNGSLTYWDGVKFTKLETGTNLAISDMWGYGDTLVVAFSDVSSGKAGQMKTLNTLTNQFKDHSLSGIQTGTLYSIWYDRKKLNMYCSTDMWSYEKAFQDTLWKKSSFQPVSGGTFRGNSSSDIFFAGGYFNKAHFNGKSWRDMTTVLKPTVIGNWDDISLKNDMVAITGYGSGLSLILTGKHLNY